MLAEDEADAGAGITSWGCWEEKCKEKEKEN